LIWFRLSIWNQTESKLKKPNHWNFGLVRS
jgi:hypothetical protein